MILTTYTRSFPRVSYLDFLCDTFTGRRMLVLSDQSTHYSSISCLQMRLAAPQLPNRATSFLASAERPISSSY